MSKKILLFSGLLCFFFAMLLGGCKDKKADNGPKKTVFEQSLTNQDSLEVAQLVSTFFESVKGQKYDDAAAMLYRVEDGVPRPLDNKEMEKEKVVLRTFPVVLYNIDYMKFDEKNTNEVKVTITMREAQDGQPALTTVFYLNPVKVMNTWKLCVIDSGHNDFPIIKGSQRDSMKDEYDKEMREKESK